MGQGIDDLSLETLLELFQAITEPRGEGGDWRAQPSTDAAAEGGPFERVVAPLSDRAPDEPVPMAEATDADSGTWLWLEH
jgi:hypothetical protein